VTKPVLPYAVVAGNPARLVKMREGSGARGGEAPSTPE